MRDHLSYKTTVCLCMGWSFITGFTALKCLISSPNKSPLNNNAYHYVNVLKFSNFRAS